MRTIIILLLALLVLILAFFSYEETKNIVNKDQDMITYQTGYGISGVGVVPYCKKVWSDNFKRYIIECKRTNKK